MIARLPKQDISFFKENPRLAGDILFLKGGNKNPSSEGLQRTIIDFPIN